MAYVQPQSANRRLAIIGSVAALHGAAIFALVTGFAATVWERVEVRMPTTNYRADPPPPPDPVLEPSPQPAEQNVFVPMPLATFTPRDEEVTGALTPIPMPIPLPGTGSGDAIEHIVPSPTPSFVPRAASPLGNPGRWATSEDYPAAALRDGREGTTRFRVTVGVDGRVRNCEVTGSSGSPDLDRATCVQVSKRGRFKPATDASGAIVSGSWSSAVRWEIPL